MKKGNYLEKVNYDGWSIGVCLYYVLRKLLIRVVQFVQRNSAKVGSYVVGEAQNEKKELSKNN